MGLFTALAQSVSYLASAYFINKHGSAFKLLICSQLFMGIFSALLLPFLPPMEIFSSLRMGWGCLLVWVTMFFLGQGGFFFAQKQIESSRLASLLGLKIIVLSSLWMILNGTVLNPLQFTGVLLCVTAAFAMNWSGKSTMPLKGLAALMITLICYSLTDLSETAMVNLQSSGSMSVVKSGISVTLLCYVALGICSLPFAGKIKWNWQIQKDAIFFSCIWLFSQMTLLICFGMLGPVFGNVIQATRGIFSVLLGVLACRLGIRGVEKNIPNSMWIRRILAALLMLISIVCFSFGQISR